MNDHLQAQQPEPPVDRAKVRQLLQPCVDRLTNREREVLYLLQPWLTGADDPEERSLGEVAALQSAAKGQSITRNSVAQASFVMRQKLKRCLEERGFRTVTEILENAS